MVDTEATSVKTSGDDDQMNETVVNDAPIKFFPIVIEKSSLSEEVVRDRSKIGQSTSETAPKSMNNDRQNFEFGIIDQCLLTINGDKSMSDVVMTERPSESVQRKRSVENETRPAPEIESVQRSSLKNVPKNKRVAINELYTTVVSEFVGHAEKIHRQNYQNTTKESDEYSDEYSDDEADEVDSGGTAEFSEFMSHSEKMHRENYH